jgi:hypothetical protein
VPSRRELTFASLDGVMPEVERLLDGHTTVGQWSLAQICRHLATSIRRTVGGSPSTRERSDFDALRIRFFRSGRIPEGIEMPTPALKPPPGLDARAEADALGTAIAGLAQAEGPFPDHPLLGPLTAEEWRRFHAIHCAHHLGFALPNGAE